MALTAALGCLPKAAASDLVGPHQMITMGYGHIFGCIVLLPIFVALWHAPLSAIFKRIYGIVLEAVSPRVLPSCTGVRTSYRKVESVTQHEPQHRVLKLRTRRSIRKWRHHRGKITVQPVFSKTTLLEKIRKHCHPIAKTKKYKGRKGADGARGGLAESAPALKSLKTMFLYGFFP